MKQKRGFIRFYLLLALAFGFLGLVDTSLTFFDVTNNIYAHLVMLISILFFFFNVFSIPIFYLKRVERIAFIFPIYHIIVFLLFFGFGFLMTYKALFFEWMWIVLIALGFVSALFEVIFSIYLMGRLKVFEED